MNGGETKIPCTVAVLTLNNERTLARALASAGDFAELLVCDGGSSDRTRAIARAQGARVISQDPECKDAAGRIIDFAGVHNQALRASSFDWHFYLDSDEALTPELVGEIRGIVANGAPAVYWVDRKYELEGRIVDCAATYPTRQMRLFHKNSVTGFIKPIHERIAPKPGAALQKTENFMLVPISADPRVWRQKWEHYIALEVARRGKISLWQWLSVCFESMKISALYALRFTFRVLFCRGTKMPWRLEWERHMYHWNLCRALWRSAKSF